jgi:DNA polymerase III epsilon subunit-like protein
MTRKNRHIVFDTETTGIPECSIDLVTGERKYYDPNRLDKYAKSRVVQLAWIVLDDHGKKIVSKTSYVIKPDGYTIPEEATKVHGITHDFAAKNGVSMRHALKAFQEALESAHTVVAHNFLFDAYVLSSEAVRYGFTGLPKALQATNKFDTMVRAMQYFNLGKKPRLVDLYRILFKTEIDQRHDALDDAMITAACFSDLKSAMYRSKLRPHALVAI